MDLKYINNETAFKYSKCDNYTTFAFDAIKAAYELQNEPIFDENGILQKGLIVRHLILPQHTNDAIKVIDWFKENTPNAILSIMSQYVPMYNAEKFKEINRPITKREYDKVIDYVLDKWKKYDGNKKIGCLSFLRVFPNDCVIGKKYKEIPFPIKTIAPKITGCITLAVIAVPVVITNAKSKGINMFI